MKDARFERALASAAGAGLLLGDTAAPRDPPRPWPVVVLTVLGAWLAAIPLLFVVMLLWLQSGETMSLWVMGVLALAAGVAILRAPTKPFFAEQLALPVLLAGMSLLAYCLWDALPKVASTAVLALLSLALAMAVPQPWFRALSGAAAAVSTAMALSALQVVWWQFLGSTAAWSTAYVLLAVGCLAWWFKQRARASLAVWLESVTCGWMLATVASLAASAGTTLLMRGFLPEWVTQVLGQIRSGAYAVDVSLLLAAMGAAWCWWRWPATRQWVLLAVLLPLMALVWLAPALGVLLLIVALSATAQRWRLASAAGLAALWTLGATYYRLALPLTDKALLLVAVGTALGAAAWWLARRDPPVVTANNGAKRRWDRRATAIAFSTLLTLAIAGAAIWQKQHLIANGQRVFLELVPVDRRSLMQGDHMALQFRLPPMTPGDTGATPHPLQAVARRYDDGAATLLRLRLPGEPLAPGEMAINLVRKNGSWTVVTDAWFFAEGEGARWASARFGELRVAPDGTAVLVGMVDKDLRPLLPGAR